MIFFDLIVFKIYLKLFFLNNKLYYFHFYFNNKFNFIEINFHFEFVQAKGIHPTKKNLIASIKLIIKNVKEKIHSKKLLPVTFTTDHQSKI